VPLHYRRAGSGPPLVLLHGASGNLRDWSFAEFAGLTQDFDVIAFDRPGHGLSGWPSPGGETLRGQARLMRTALERMGIARALVAGHSYGGAVALGWALDMPDSVAGLLLIAAPSQVWPGGGIGPLQTILSNRVAGPLFARGAAALVSEQFIQARVRRAFAPQPAPAGYFEHLRRELVLHPQNLRRNARQLKALKREIRPMVPLYPELAMPIELLHGTADRTVPIQIHAEPFARQVPAARLTRLEGIGHMPQHAVPEAVRDALGRLRDASGREAPAGETLRGA
jgi:pimeloyl-ACP methyl ester carboxylesterase